MANSKKHYWVAGLIFLAIAVVYMISPQSFSGLNVANSGVPQSPVPINAPNPTTASTTVCPNSQPSCQVTVNLVNRDALDQSSSLTDATNVATSFYKSPDGVKFYALGSNTGTVFTYDASFNNVVYMGVTIPAGQSFYVAPNSIADKTLNPRILGFDFKDFLGTGTKQWLFKIDMTNLPAPTAGQTSSTLAFTILAYKSATDSLNSPADITSVSTTAGTQTFIRWIDTVTADKANAHYEYEIKINTTNTALWNIATSTLDIPNIGTKGLGDMASSQDGSSTFYKYTLSNDLAKTNYVASPKNGDTAHYFTFKLSSNFVASSGSANVLVTFTIRSLSASQGGQSASDAVKVCSDASC